MKGVDMKTPVFCLFLLASASFAMADTDGVRLTMAIPASPMLSMELVPLTVTVTNGGMRPIPVMTNDLGRVMGVQLFFEHEQKRPVMLGAKYPFMRRHNRFADFSVLPSMTLLQPGQSFTWSTTPYGDHALYNAWRIEEATNITAYLRIGAAEWVQSPTYNFQILSNEGEYEIRNLPAYTNVTYSGFTNIRPEFCKVRLAGKHYLFTRNGVRLGELKDGDIPEIKRLSDGGISVTFQKQKEKVRFYPQKMRAELEDGGME